MAIGIAPSKNSSHDPVSRPYLWLTIAAFWELLLSIAIVGGTTISIYSGIMSHDGAIGPAIDAPKTISYVPSLLSGLIMLGGGLLLIFKRKTGIYASIIGLVSFPAYLFTYWNILAFGESASIGVYIYSLPFALVIFGPPLAMLVIGWKRVKWN